MVRRPRGPRPFRLSSVAFVLACVLATSGARAQTDDQKSGARAAAAAGAQAFVERRWSDAVDLFSRAESLVHSPVHVLYIARSFERLGSLVKAREAYIRLQNEELPESAPAPLRDAKADAERELEALEKRVPYVSVVVQGAGPRPVTVTMDGVAVPPALMGVPRPVDPGEHRFEAMSEGMQSARSSVIVRESGSDTVVLTLTPAPALAPAPVAPAPVAPAPAPAAPTAAQPAGPPPGYAFVPASAPVNPAPPPGADEGGRGPSPLTWVAFGVGAVGLGVGTVFAVMAKGKADDANALCRHPDPFGGSSTDNCDETQKRKVESLDDSHRTDKTVAIAGFVTGGLGVAAGLTLLFTSGGASEPPPAPRAGVTPWVGLGSAGVAGRF